jgi:hypothetical protein
MLTIFLKPESVNMKTKTSRVGAIVLTSRGAKRKNCATILSVKRNAVCPDAVQHRKPLRIL